MDSYEYVIIGNGILGIHLGRFLKSQNKKYIILEKSRNIGGRFSSRRFEKYKFNFGARSFKWDGLFFKEEIEFGIENHQLIFKDGVIRPTSTFNDWTKDLAKSLNFSQVNVQSIRRSFNGDFIINDKISARRLILTAPAPQTYELVKDLGCYEFLKAVSYSKESFYMYSSKNDYKEVDGLTLMSSNKIENINYFFCAVDKWDEISREDLKSKYDKLTNPLDSFAHKWRYSKIEKTVEYQQVDTNIFCLGDYYEGEVKGSFNSALNLKNSI